MKTWAGWPELRRSWIPCAGRAAGACGARPMTQAGLWSWQVGVLQRLLPGLCWQRGRPGRGRTVGTRRLVCRRVRP
ncbi:hypothetical protein NDU88_002877 [Pleurodeles waltl]|uniref:Uncharacterized protein n=1 Tax=Pleurodeles waltl TaxID=8319 RepID=A0AAV7QE43_PLEWA|nr:hypothetical protein NDU88_002877 [Pleurodeles waltl]